MSKLCHILRITFLKMCMKGREVTLVTQNSISTWTLRVEIPVKKTTCADLVELSGTVHWSITNNC